MIGDVILDSGHHCIGAKAADSFAPGLSAVAWAPFLLGVGVGPSFSWVKVGPSFSWVRLALRVGVGPYFLGLG